MDYWVVVVDDEVLSLTNARNLLGEEKIKVSCLKSGQDLLRFVNKNMPDLILLDIMMPEMDGFETLRRLRKAEEEAGKPHIPVIFLTGENDMKAEQQGLALGASDFIHKPFNKEILLRRIENTVKNKKTIETLTEEANTDTLTGFWNKARGAERAEKLCAERNGMLIIMDLDSFKLVNDLFGHDLGDKVLRSFSEIIRKNVRKSDMVSRIGGDEFLAFLEGLTEESIAALTLHLNTDLKEAAIQLLGQEHGIPLGVSVGAVAVPKYGTEYQELFSMADSALYTVKQNGKHGYSIYEISDLPEEEQGSDLEREIERIGMIIDERNENSGGLLLGREAFSMVYRFIQRFYKRYGGFSVRILFSLKAWNSDNENSVTESRAAFGQFLQKELRRSDLILQHRSDQYFVVLNESTRFEADDVIRRILQDWENSGSGKDIRIEIAYRSTEFKGTRP